MGLKSVSRVKGAIMDVARLQALPDDDCHVLFVSSRTLYLLANYATSEVNFLSRYAESFTDDGYYQPVQPGAALEIVKNDIANRFSVEVIPVCEELVAAISDVVAQLGLINTSIGEIKMELGGIEGTINQTTLLSGCCTPYGPEYPPTAPDLEDPETGDPPEDWETWEAYYTYKCAAANRIADEWISSTGGMGTLSGAAGAIGAIALALFLNTSLLGGLLVGLIAIGFSAAAAAAIIIAALIAIVVGGTGLLAYFAALSAEMEANKQTLVCGLFYAVSPAGAKAILVDFTADVAGDLDYDPGDDDTLFQAQLSVIANALFSEAVTNSLFELDAESADYSGDVDCADCSLALLVETVGTVDTGRAFYDADVTANMVDYTTHWTHEGPNNQWNGFGKGTEPEDPPFPSGNPTTLWFRVRYSAKQPSGRAGWMGLQVSQSAVIKYNGRFVCGAGCYGSFVDYDTTFSVSVNTIFPAADDIILTIMGEKDFWEVKDVIWELVEEP